MTTAHTTTNKTTITTKESPITSTHGNMPTVLEDIALGAIAHSLDGQQAHLEHSPALAVLSPPTTLPTIRVQQRGTHVEDDLSGLLAGNVQVVTYAATEEDAVALADTVALLDTPHSVTAGDIFRATAGSTRTVELLDMFAATQTIALEGAAAMPTLAGVEPVTLTSLSQAVQGVVRRPWDSDTTPGVSTAGGWRGAISSQATVTETARVSRAGTTTLTLDVEAAAHPNPANPGLSLEAVRARTRSGVESFQGGFITGMGRVSAVRMTSAQDVAGRGHVVKATFTVQHRNAA